jgi:TonB-linked SusC/RagA family outer membrane protein
MRNEFYSMVRTATTGFLLKQVLDEKNRLRLMCLSFLVFFFSLNLIAGNSSVTKSLPVSGIKVIGKIVDEEGIPLISATVVIKGTTTAVVSDAEGNYTITVPSESSVLEFSFVGYLKQQIIVGKKTVIDVQMKSDARTSLKEMVVVGYAVEQKALLTGSVGVIQADKIKDIPVPTLDGVLQGQVSGVQVSQNSGTPGGGMSVRIRGLSSVSGTNQPLYVIDGIPVTTGDYAQIGYEGQGTNALSDLNPSDIESISVLKDAAAASIYGARATNGVVVITTKRGKSGKSNISINATYGVQQVAKKLKMLNARQWMEYRNDLSGTTVFTQDQMDNITVDTDWQDVIFRTAPTSKIEASAGGGNEKTKYFMSGDYFQQDGTLIGTDYSRLNGRLNLDHSLSDKITIGASLGISYAKTNRVEGDQSLQGVLPNGISTPAIYPVYNADGTYNQDGPYSNAVSIANEATNENFSFRTLGNAFLNYNIIRNLTFSTKWGVDFLNFREHAFEYNTVQGKKYNGLGFETYNNVLNLVSNNTLKYSLSLKNHSLEILGGYSFEKKQTRSSYIRGQDYPNASLQYVVSAAYIVQSYANSLDEGTESFFGRLNYNFANKYIVSFSGRADASSNFPPNNHWGFFPSASIAWRIGEEKSFHLPTQINDLKVRGSYGLTGNDDITPFSYQELYAVTNYNKKPGYYPSNLPNPHLKWETTAQLNLGLDLGLFQNRISFSFDYYNKQTRDLLLDRPLPGSTGYSSITENIGKVENKGIELNLTTINFDGPFKWTTSVNLSGNRNKVKKLYNDEPIDDIGRGGNRVMVGEPIGVFYNYKWLGIDPSTGDAVYADLNQNEAVDTKDRMVVGNPHPKFIGSVTNTFNYRGFDLSAFLQFSYGNDVFNGSRLYLESLTGGDNQLESVTRRWKKVGDITDISRATSDATATANNRRSSSRFIEDGSYLRIKNVTLGYTFNSAWTKKLKFETLRVYFTTQNLLTFTRYTGLDPEVNYAGDNNTVIGTDFFTYPQSRSFNFGINLKF